MILVGTPSAVDLAKYQITETLGPMGVQTPTGGIGTKRGADDDDYGAKRARV